MEILKKAQFLKQLYPQSRSLIKQNKKYIFGYFTWFTRFSHQKQLPSFERISHKEIQHECGMNANLVYLNKLYWTPRFYQVPYLSNEFQQELKKFKHLQVWQEKDVLALTQLILIEATRDTTFDLSFGFRAKPSPICLFHGHIDCLLYQRYGGESQGISDLKQLDNDTQGIGFPLLPIFFPVQKSSIHSPFLAENFPITQAISCGLWCLNHMNDIDPSIEYCRVIQTDGHRWKLFEIHRTHVKKTKFFEPRQSMRESTQKSVKFTSQARFFDDYEHMLSIIGLIRFAMGIPENIVMKNEAYEVEELPKQKDLQRTIQNSLLYVDKNSPLLTDKRVIKEIPFDRKSEELKLPSK